MDLDKIHVMDLNQIHASVNMNWRLFIHMQNNPTMLLSNVHSWV
jgi:hypothetical protein